MLHLQLARINLESNLILYSVHHFLSIFHSYIITRHMPSIYCLLFLRFLYEMTFVLMNRIISLLTVVKVIMN